MLLKETRIKNKLSATQLETILGLKRTTVNKWESGVVYPRGETLIKLEKILGISASEILRSIKVEKEKRNM